MTDKKMKPIDSLKFDPANSRKHDERNIKAIMDSLERHGQRKPIVCYSNMVVAGNGTLQAAKRLGWTEIWVNDDSFDSIEDAKAYAIQDNRSAELATWDDVQLGDTLTELKDAGWDLEQIGFDDSDLKDLIDKPQGTDGLTDPDDVPDVAQNEFGVKRGDIWILGNHRLMCGDSTDKATVEKLMNGEKADMVFTDPPYGMNLDTDYRSMGSKNNFKPIAGDGDDFRPELIITIFRNFEYCKEIFLFGADYYAELIPNKNEGSWVVWDKRSHGDDNIGTLDGSFGADFELCWSRYKHQRKMCRVIRNKGAFIKKREGIETVHPSQKPVEMVAWFFDQWGKETKLVADIFLGSGSTLIACEKTGRKCYGMELDEHYCSVIIKRWQDFTGKKAERIVEGA